MNVVVVCNKLNKKTMKEYLPSKKHNINVLGIIISVKNKDELIRQITEVYNPHALFWVNGVPCGSKNKEISELEILTDLKKADPNLKIFYSVVNRVEIDNYDEFVTELIRNGIYNIITGVRTVDDYHRHLLSPITNAEAAFKLAKVEMPENFKNEDMEREEQEQLSAEFEETFDENEFYQNSPSVAAIAPVNIEQGYGDNGLNEYGKTEELSHPESVAPDEEVPDFINENIDELIANSKSEEYFANKEETTEETPDTADTDEAEDVPIVSFDDKPQDLEELVTEEQSSAENVVPDEEVPDFIGEDVDELISNSNSEEYFSDKEEVTEETPDAADTDEAEDVPIVSFDDKPQDFEELVTEAQGGTENVVLDEEVPDFIGEDVDELIANSKSEEYFANKEETTEETPDTADTDEAEDVPIVSFDDKPQDLEELVTEEQSSAENVAPDEEVPDFISEDVDELIANSNSEEYFADKEEATEETPDTEDTDEAEDVPVVSFDDKPQDFEESITEELSHPENNASHHTALVYEQPKAVFENATVNTVAEQSRFNPAMLTAHITVAVSQLIRRTGCTHVSVELASFLKQKYSVGVVFSDNETYLNFADYLNVECSVNDGFKYNGVSYYSPACLSISQGNHEITIKDFGIVSDDELTEYEKCPYKLLVADFGFWNVSVIEKYIVDSAMSYVPQTYFLFNLTGVNRFTDKILPLAQKGYKVFRLSASESCFEYSAHNAEVYGRIFNLADAPQPKKKQGLFKRRKNN
ncbi:MAG: hypothetical protein ACLTCP_01290 [Ruminococcus bicirculans (ex Wegman et al. 2014)]